MTWTSPAATGPASRFSGGHSQHRIVAIVSARHGRTSYRGMLRCNGRACTGLLAVLTLVACVAAGLGCGSSPPPGIPEERVSSAGERAASPDPDSRAASNAPPSETRTAVTARNEFWDVFFIDDSKVGYSHTRFSAVREDGQALLRIESDSKLTLRRFGQLVQQQLSFSTVETADGELVRCACTMTNETVGGETTMTTNGRVAEDQLQLEISTLGKTTQAAIPWNPEWGGYFAVDRSLQRQPMAPGERRRLTALTPGFNQTAEIELNAVRYESAKLLQSDQELLRIDTRITLANNTLEQTIWTDRAGQTLKSFMPALNQTSYRTTPEVATDSDTGDFDLGERSLVKVEQPIDRPHLTERAVYRVKVAGSTSFDNFAQGITQRVEKIDDETREITVRSLRPTDDLGQDFPADASPTDGDRLPNSLVQSDDPDVQALAQKMVADQSDAWQVAVTLEAKTREFISNKGFAQALASAADVVQSREGDCTEHAVLLTALLRARQIPARVAIGLVYFQPAHGFAYHMWTEAWIGDRWIPLDATLGLGGIGAAHIKVSHSDLKGVDPLSQFLPVFQLFGNTHIEVVRYE